MDWGTFAAQAALTVMGFGYLTRVIHREVDSVRGGLADLATRVTRLEDAYIRHLEHHAAR